MSFCMSDLEHWPLPILLDIGGRASTITVSSVNFQWDFSHPGGVPSMEAMYRGPFVWVSLEASPEIERDCCCAQ
jgi:hypothetical protein